MASGNQSDGGREYLHAISKICLLVAGLAALALVVLVQVLEPAKGGDYAEAVGQLALLKSTLERIMILGALVLLALSCITTWFIAMYSSFRIAGPLYRLARNLETLVAQRRPALLPLRTGDRLQQEALELNISVQSLVEQYARFEAALAHCESASARSASAETLDEAVAELRQVASRAQY